MEGPKLTQKGIDFIIARLSRRFDEFLKRGDDLRTLARAAGATDLVGILDDYPECKAERVVSSVPTERILLLEAKAVALGFSLNRSLLSYWRLDIPRTERLQELFDRLSQTDSLERAYIGISGSDPQVNAADDVFAIQQLHLNAAPVGIDARWAWTQPDGSGTSVGFVDLEQGWTFSHEDLPRTTPLPGVPGDVKPASMAHGTGVMGIAVGVDNAVGIIGVAPTPAWASVASHYRSLDGTSDHVADAIYALLASGGLAPGDVLLIEHQNGFNLPSEVDPWVGAAIEVATALGTIVIEAAGNGNVDLDTVPELNRLDRSTFIDSRAVIVGASRSSLDAAGQGHDRWVLALPGPGSNFGSRVDCYAYGENVVTAGPGFTAGGVLGGTGPTNEYRRDFGGTSAAAAIVAGAAVVLQSMYKAAKGAPLSPVQMRDALSTHGTPQGVGQPGHIGVMPDLKDAATALGIVRGSPSAPTNVRIC
jgi:serine protease